MKIKDVKKILEKKEVEEKDWFSEYFNLGNYSYQDTNLEKDYSIEDGSVFTIVDKEHEYAYISILDKDEMQVYDCYVTYETYNQIDSLLN